MRPRAAVVVAVLMGGGLIGLVGCGDDERAASTTPSTTPGTTNAAAGGSTFTGESSACATATGVPQLTTLLVSMPGVSRTALVHPPTGWNGTDPLPVIVSFHGAAQDAVMGAVTDRFDGLADRVSFLSVHPQGRPVFEAKYTKEPGWDVTRAPADEVAFVSAMLDELGRQFCIDPSRVYTAGYSNGGEMARLAACSLPDRIAAFASVEAPFHPEVCAGGPPVAAIAFHGLDDLIVPYDDHTAFTDAQIVANGCRAMAEVVAVSSRVLRAAWPNCTRPLISYQLTGHGHSWPGNPFPVSREDLIASVATNPLGVITLTPEQTADTMLLTNNDINASEVIWQFFREL